MKTVAVVGASADRRKFGNKAVRAFAAQGFRVIPVNPHESEIEGLPVARSVAAIAEPVDMVSVYVPPAITLTVLDDLAEKEVGEVWLNPGSDDVTVVSRARALGLNVIQACSIVGIGDSPWRY
ncbi:MAG: CoA-binding protein [Vicinamibacteraceae bacterium]|nr:CoA-binding protein [Vicinamibacteraceae bacterium]